MTADVLDAWLMHTACLEPSGRDRPVDLSGTPKNSTSCICDG